MGDIKNAGVKDTLTEKFGRVYSTKRNKWNCIKIQWDREELWQNVNLTTRKIVYHCKDDINEVNETEVEEESLSNFLSSAGDSSVNDEKIGNVVSDDQLQSDPSDSTSKGIEDTVKKPGERTGFRLVVDNLSSRTSWQDLKDYMRQAGDILYTNTNHRSSGEGIVEFGSRSDMEWALDKLS